MFQQRFSNVNIGQALYTWLRQRFFRTKETESLTAYDAGRVDFTKTLFSHPPMRSPDKIRRNCMAISKLSYYSSATGNEHPTNIWSVSHR